MSRVKILWSIITGRTGREALEIAKELEWFEIRGIDKDRI